MPTGPHEDPAISGSKRPVPQHGAEPSAPHRDEAAESEAVATELPRTAPVPPGEEHAAEPASRSPEQQRRSADLIWVLFVLSGIGQIGIGIFALFRAQDLPSDIPGVEVLDAWAWAWIVLGLVQLICAMLLSRRTVLGRMVGLALAGFLFLMWVYLFSALPVQGLIFAILNALAFVQLIRRGSLYTV